MTARAHSAEDSVDEQPVPEEAEQLSIRPYARLLTMLGEQLIRSDRVALVELLKNCYDADATLAKVIFSNFDDQLKDRPHSTIALVDNGDGMSEEVIRQHWLNPATAIKAERKSHTPHTAMKRVIQGEKGIGRFAMFKLGNAASVVTRSRDSDTESVLDYDLSFLDDTSSPNQQYLDEIRVSFRKRAPITFDGSNTGGNRSTHGTRIEIQNLRGEWSEQTASQAFNDIVRLQPLVPARSFDAPVSGEQFRVEFWSDDAELSLSSGFEQRLQKLFEERAVLRVNGLVDDASGDLVLEVNEEPLSLNIFDAELAGLRVHKNYFPNRQRVDASRVLACGPFSFSFFVFDFSATSPPEHRLDSSEKKLVRDHRIYLYRDGVRVLPYGDPHDDWLQLDVIRGTQGASRVLGNDQTVGFVHISHSDNPMLRDKTNREGLLDEGGTYADFVAVLQVIVAYVRSGPYARYVLGKQRVRETTHRQEYDIAQLLIDVRDDPAMPPSLQSSVSAIVSAYEAERKYLVVRAERTEDLAGVGLSVESASHDIIAAGGRALQLIQAINSYVTDQMPRNKPLRRQLDDLTELLRFITSRLNDVQGLFVSTRQGKRRLDIGRIAERVGKMFRYVLEQSKIEFSVREPFGPLVIRSSQAALLQALVNLVDNAIYWVTLNQNRVPEIVIQVDSQAQRVIVADNGSGVSGSDEPFIFEPFYSAKGEEGKGLGLYIAQQIGVRSGFSVELDRELELLSGANLVISFTQDPK